MVLRKNPSFGWRQMQEKRDWSGWKGRQYAQLDVLQLDIFPHPDRQPGQWASTILFGTSWRFDEDTRGSSKEARLAVIARARCLLNAALEKLDRLEKFS